MVYFLLPAVIIIWGFIIYRVVTWIGDKNMEVSKSIVKKDNFEKPKLQDTFSLLLNYSDPFGLSQIKSSGKKGKTKYQGTTWPAIRYFGKISGGKNKKKLATLNISGVNAIMKEGDTCKGIKLIAIHRSSVLLYYKGEHREIDREPDKK